MKSNKLINFLLNSTNNSFLTDEHWNSVQFLARFDLEADTKGKPVYSDHSRYKYHVREIKGTSEQSGFSIVTNGNPAYPVIPDTSTINIDSFIHIPNSFNHTLRINEINTGKLDNSTIRPTYLDVLIEGGDVFNLGTDDFTIELSFYSDELGLAWSQGSQCLFNVGLNEKYNEPLNITTFPTYGTWFGQGFGLFIRDRNLFFVANAIAYQCNIEPLNKLEWYHIAVVRKDNTLLCYINGVLINSHVFSIDLTRTKEINANTFLERMHIGANPRRRIILNQNSIYRNAIDSSFSGGLSNFRLTKGVARYFGSFYSVHLPLPVLDVQNKLDNYYNQTLLNVPMTFDMYDYGKNYIQFENKQLLQRTVLDYNYGWFYLKGNDFYDTEPWLEALSNEQWTLEFYLCPCVNGLPDNVKYNSFRNWLLSYNVNEAYNNNFNFDLKLLSLLGDDNKVISELTFHIHKQDQNQYENFATYFSIKFSENGTDFITYPSEANININAVTSVLTPKILPSDQIKFLYSGAADISGLPNNYFSGINTGYEDPNFHIAIQKQGNFLYFFVNGVLNKTIPFNFTLYNASSYKLRLGSIFSEILGRKFNTDTNVFDSCRLSLAIKGLRLSNAARYNTTEINNYPYLHSLHPLALDLNKREPPRARIIDIVRKNISSTVSSSEVEWLVFTTAQVSNLKVSDFTLSQLEGVNNAFIESITKDTEYQYTVRVNTGEGNGRLGLNFTDNRTVYYKNTTTPISNYTGELSVEGGVYVINKSAPKPILTSGSSPYVSGAFDVTLSFNSAIEQFYPDKIGIVNGKISNIRLLDDILNIYSFTVTPLATGTVTVQTLVGCGVTDTGFESDLSAPFVRVFADYFPILQIPFTTNFLFKDFSPSKHTLNEIIPNNTTYNNSISPVGVQSSLSVVPQLEQSGFKLENFNAIGSNFTSFSNEDWTIEWFYRGDTTGNKFTHLMSVEAISTGFSIIATNGSIQMRRSVSSTSNLFPSVIFAEKDTTSFIDWANSDYTELQKFPHFAITKQGDVYRFYRNGIRVGLVQSTTQIDITKGNLYIGYYPNRVSDTSYLLSNVRITFGKALYTSYSVNVPTVPYEVLPDITDAASLLNYISIYSNQNNSQVAKAGDRILLYFTSIVKLSTVPNVTISGKEADVVELDYNTYIASIDITNDDTEGEVSFSIDIAGEPGIPTTSFTQTSNNTKVFIDNTKPTINIYSNSPINGSHVVDCILEASEELQEVNKDIFSNENCILSNFYHLKGTNIYTFTATAIISGEFSISVDADSVFDKAGNGNIASNTFIRSSIVPAYIPDPHWSNVVFLLQPSTVIEDESLFNVDIEDINIEIVNDTAPAGLTKSMRFNGRDSSLHFELPNSLGSNSPYTIEMFVYVKSSTLFKLAPPRALPASNISQSSFNLNWTAVPNASSYVIDIAKDSGFTAFVPQYKSKEVGNVTNFPITSSEFSYAPEARPVPIIGSKGFVASWKPVKEDTILGYRYDVALDSNFVNKLNAFSNKLTNTTNAIIGSIENSKVSNVFINEENSEVTSLYNPTQGVLIKGIFSNNNYPKLYYFNEESSIRFYDKKEYTIPAIAEDIDVRKWIHLAIVNDVKYTKLYVDGIYQDKVKNVSVSSAIDVGYDIGAFEGYITGIRITKNTARYTDSFKVPTLPYPKN